MQSKSVLARLTAGALCVLMGGCALTSPLRGPTPPAAVAKGAPSPARPTTAEDILADSRLYAQDMANVYWKSAKAHSHAKTALATALPIVNVGALYNAQTHPDPGNDFLAVAGYGSALGLTLGSLLISPERQRIYLAGQAASLCALHRTDGYVIQSEFRPYLTPDGGTFGAALREARVARADVTALVAELERHKKGALAYAEAVREEGKTRKLAAKESRKSAKAEAEAIAKTWDNAAANDGYAVLIVGHALARADAVINDSTTTRQGLADFASRRRTAGQALRAEIDGVRNAVDIQVLRTEPDIKQIRASLSATALASLRAPGEPPTTDAQGLADIPSSFVMQRAIDARLQRLQHATDALALLREEAVEALTALLAGENKGAQNTNCAVSNINGLVVYPPSQALKAGGEVLGIVVRASEPPVATIEGPDAGLSVVEVVVATGSLYKVRLKADASATAGDRKLMVVAGGESQAVAFKVEAAPPKPAATVPEKPVITPPSPNPAAPTPPAPVTDPLTPPGALHDGGGT